jgi:hypothetical protein
VIVWGGPGKDAPGDGLTIRFIVVVYLIAAVIIMGAIYIGGKLL